MVCTYPGGEVWLRPSSWTLELSKCVLEAPQLVQVLGAGCQCRALRLMVISVQKGFSPSSVCTADRGKKRRSFQVHEINVYKKESFLRCSDTYLFCFCSKPDSRESSFFSFLSECLLVQIVWDNKKIHIRQVLVNSTVALGELLTYTAKQKPQLAD